MKTYSVLNKAPRLEDMDE